RGVHERSGRRAGGRRGARGRRHRTARAGDHLHTGRRVARRGGYALSATGVGRELVRRASAAGVRPRVPAWPRADRGVGRDRCGLLRARGASRVAVQLGSVAEGARVTCLITVPRAGLEPARLIRAHAPRTCAFTNYATWAGDRKILADELVVLCVSDPLRALSLQAGTRGGIQQR